MIHTIFSILQKILFLALHIVNPNTFPKPLSPKEELECFKKIKLGDKKSKDKIIKHNLRLVAHIIKKFNFPNQNNNEDLISVGTIGLIKAVNSFKIDKGIKFSSYASRCIENEILMSLRNAKKSTLDVSMAEPIESKSNNSLTLMDTIADKVNFHEKVFDKIDMEKLRVSMKKHLTQREQDVINLRYGLLNDNSYTQQEVAKKIGISRSYVSRIEKKALNILKNSILFLLFFF